MNKKGYRDKNGRFVKTDKKKWRENIATANSKRAHEPKQSLVKGNRIFHVEKLANGLWCSACDIPLSLRFIEEETLKGLACIFTIRCHNCRTLRKVKTSAESEHCGFSINALLALAIFDAGIGCAQLNKILSVLNIPTVNHQLMKRNETTVGIAIEKVAHASCVEALRLERDMTIAHSRLDTAQTSAASEEILIDAENIPAEESMKFAKEKEPFDVTSYNANSAYERRKLKAKMKGEEFKQSELKAAIDLFQLPKTQETVKNLQRLDSTAVGSETKVGLTLSFDGAWQKSGRAHNSMTGHATAVGSNTGLCVGYDVCTTRCRQCAAGCSKELHDCRINHYGSAKSMEPAMAERIFLQNPDFKSESVELQTLIGDDDSSTIGCLRRKSDHVITKFCDKNHAVTKLTKSLYALKLLSVSAIDYLKYLFKCAIEKNNKDVSATREAILNIVPHAFGDHATCGTWCKHTDDDNKYSRLPGGKPLSGDKLKQSLNALFKRFAGKSEELAPGASSQSNESLNRQVATLHPKDKYFGGSSSIHARVGAAIWQKNMGTVYIDAVKTELSISPSVKRSLRYRELLDNNRKRRAFYAQSAEGKKRRRKLFEARRKKTIMSEKTEGICYQSNLGIEAGVNFADVPVIPNDNFKANEDVTVVYFDIETTGLAKTDQILQIAAASAEKEFEQYIMPSKNIPSHITELTRIRMCNNQLLYNSRPVPTASCRQAVDRFIEFLNSFSGGVVLAAHNCFRFDAPMLLRLISEVVMLQEFCRAVKGFSDTLVVLKRCLVERTAAKKSFKLTTLAEEYINADFAKDMHNALVDAKVLESLIHHPEINLTNADLLKSAVTVNNISMREQRNIDCKIKKSSLNVLLAEKDEHGKTSKLEGASAGMLTKMAKAGISFMDVKNAFINSNKEGVAILLGQSVDGKPRVTTSKKIVDAIVERLAKITAQI